MRAFAYREAAAEVERIRTATRSDIEKISVAAKAEIEAAARAARLELKAVAARLAVEGAESLLTNQLTAQTQAGLISNFGKKPEGGAHLNQRPRGTQNGWRETARGQGRGGRRRRKREGLAGRKRQ